MKLQTIVLLASEAACAATLHVPAEYPTIQAAITASTDGDSVLVSSGTYFENVRFLGRAIVVLSEDGYSSTVIDGSQPAVPDSGSVVSFVDGEGPASVIQGFTITGGTGTASATTRKGGGVLCMNTSPTLLANFIVANSVFAVDNSYGGGVLCSTSDAHLEGNIIIDNSAGSQNGHGYGGGVCFVIESSPSISCNTILENQATYGGGIYGKHTSSAVISNNVVCGNTAVGGGGIACNPGTAPTVVNNTVAGNIAVAEGGGVWTNFAQVAMANCILWGNDAPSGPQGWIGPDCSVEIDYCDIQFGQDSLFCDPTSSIGWGSGLLDMDPLFESGPLSDYQLQEDLSPCVDAGDPASTCNDPEDPGNPGFALWPALGLLRNDMGAYGGGGAGYWVGIQEQPSMPVESPSLVLCPNPFAIASAVVFNLPEAGHAAISAFDMSGRLVATISEGEFQAGPHSALFSASGLPDGVYLCRLRTAGASASCRVVLLR